MRPAEASFSLICGYTAVWIAIQYNAAAIKIIHKIHQFKAQSMSLYT
jgi:hypothetical protein